MHRESIPSGRLLLRKQTHCAQPCVFPAHFPTLEKMATLHQDLTPSSPKREPASAREQITLVQWIAPSLFLFSLVCYANTLLNGFVYDDELQLLSNPYVKSWHYLPEIFRTTVWSFIGAAGESNYYRPMMTFTYLLLWKAFGDLPFGYHLFNIVLNALVVVAVYFAGNQLFKSIPVAAVAAALFALHPIHTETVNWIAAVPDLEATFFFLLAFLLYVRKPILDWKSHLLIAACYLASMLAKEPAVLLAPLLVCYQHFVREDRAQITFSTKLRQYLPVCLVGIGYLIFRRLLFGNLAPVLQHPDIGWRNGIFSAFALIAQYARLLFWPTHLSAFHTFHASQTLRQPGVLPGIAIVLGCLSFLAVFYKRQPRLAFCVLWIGLTLGPVLNVRWMAANVLTERYLYLPSVAFCWLVGSALVYLWGAIRNPPQLRTAWRAVLSLVCLAIAVLSIGAILRRNRVWQDDLTLYLATLKTDPDAWVMHLNLGTTYFAMRDFSAAGIELRRALELKPGSANALNALGCVYLEQGRLDEASQALRDAIAAKPRWTDAHFNYGRVLKKTGQDDLALAEFRTAVETGPLNANAHLYLGQELAARGQTAAAEAELRESIRLYPSLTAQKQLADLLLSAGRDSDAMAVLQQIAREYSYDSATHLKLARLLESKGKMQEALKEYSRALNQDPGNIEAREALTRLQNKQSQSKPD